jgi:hypothetical protein
MLGKLKQVYIDYNEANVISELKNIPLCRVYEVDVSYEASVFSCTYALWQRVADDMFAHDCYDYDDTGRSNIAPCHFCTFDDALLDLKYQLEKLGYQILTKEQWDTLKTFS